MTALRQCNECKRFLPKTGKHFTPHRSSKDGLLRTCKSCRNAKDRAKRLEAKTGLLITVEEAKQLLKRKEYERKLQQQINENVPKSKQAKMEMEGLFRRREDYRQDRKALKRAIKRVNNRRNTGGWKYIAHDLNRRGYRKNNGNVFTASTAREYALSFGIRRKWK